MLANGWDAHWSGPSPSCDLQTILLGLLIISEHPEHHSSMTKALLSTHRIYLGSVFTNIIVILACAEHICAGVI